MDPHEAAPNVGGSLQAGRFYRLLAGVVAFGLAFRVGYVLIVTRHENKAFYDAFWYAYTAAELKNGHFFTLGHSPTAAHPPLTSLILGSVNLVTGFNPGATAMRLTMAVLGAAVVLCVGLLGRSVAGPWVGLTAAALAAVYPNMWMPSGILMSETPAMLFTALILLAIVRIYRSPTFGNAALLGVLCGAEALVRAELILFVPCLLLPAVLAARKLSVRRRLALLGIGLLATGIVLAPWVGRNLATFQDPTYLSTGDGPALLGANCPATYGHWALGYWYACPQSVVDPGSGDESVISARYVSRAVRYASDHQSRLPAVVLARIGRTWDLYAPIAMVREGPIEGRPIPAQFAGLVFYYALLPFGVAGIVILRRRNIRQWFLLVPAGVVTLVSVLYYGTYRFRAPFEVCLVVLAAPALVLSIQWLARRAARRPAITEHTDDVIPASSPPSRSASPS